MQWWWSGTARPRFRSLLPCRFARSGRGNRRRPRSRSARPLPPCPRRPAGARRSSGESAWNRAANLPASGSRSSARESEASLPATLPPPLLPAHSESAEARGTWMVRVTVVVPELAGTLTGEKTVVRSCGQTAGRQLDRIGKDAGSVRRADGEALRHGSTWKYRRRAAGAAGQADSESVTAGRAITNV